MISRERQDELYAIATEIFEALSCERYEPSERGAGWAPTDKGEEAVVAILGRAKARMWSDSPAEKRKFAIARRKEKAKKIAERLLGERPFIGKCIHCGHVVVRLKGKALWATPTKAWVCRANRNSRYHEVAG